MAKLKITLDPASTFTCNVGIPVPGVEAAIPMKWTFRHRTKDELDEWRENVDVSKGVSTKVVMEMATAWELENPYDEENVERFLQKFPGAGLALFVKYMNEQVDAKLGNLGR